MQPTPWETQIYPNRVQFLISKKFYLTTKNTELRAHLFIDTHSNTLQKVQTLKQIQDLNRTPKRIPTFSEQHQLFYVTAHWTWALPKGRL